MGTKVLRIAVSVLLLVFSLPAIVSAQIIFSEIRYDVPGSDKGREWIEIQNISAEPVSLFKWKLVEGNTHHAILGDTATVTPGSFAVIVRERKLFFTDYPTFQGQIFTSAFSFSNVGEAIVLENKEGTVIDRLDYRSAFGASSDGSSLQKINEAWLASAPTPGAKNEFKVVTVPETKRVTEQAPDPAQKKQPSQVIESKAVIATTTALKLSNQTPRQTSGQKGSGIVSSIGWLVLLIVLTLVCLHFGLKSVKVAEPPTALRAEDFKIIEEEERES